ncbi:MAG: hypothetical protein HY900_16230 [Deltaproteobacteria bacterium]|nr:hypothetical protein [Deltaproteobacteria bacterium]
MGGVGGALGRTPSSRHDPGDVDFYAATVEHALGVPKEYFTTLLAIARTPGWIAHVLEQYSDNFVPIAER